MYLYLGITIFFVVLFTLSSNHAYTMRFFKESRAFLWISVFLTIIFLVIAIILMPKVGDAGVYAIHYEKMVHHSLKQSLDIIGFEKGFVCLSWIIAKVTPNYNLYRLTIFCMELVLLFAAIKNIGYKNDVFVILIFLWNIFTLAYFFSALRQGIAMMIFIFTLSLYYKPSNGWNKMHFGLMVVLPVLMVSMHRSSIILIPLYIILTTKFVVKTRNSNHMIMAIIVFILTLSLTLGFKKKIVTSVEEQFVTSAERYGKENIREIYEKKTGKTGVRADFLLFNFIPLIFSIYMLKKRKLPLMPIHYSYFYTCLLYVPFINISFADRFAAYTIIQMPMFIVYHIQFMKRFNTISFYLLILVMSYSSVKFWPIYISRIRHLSEIIDERIMNNQLGVKNYEGQRRFRYLQQ